MLESKDSESISVKIAEKYLRGIKTKEAILNRMKRIEVFKGADAIKYLMNAKKLSTANAKETMICLLNNHYVARVKCTNKEQEQYTFLAGYEFNINHEYMWMVEGSALSTFAIGIGLLTGTFTVALFPIWPRFARIGTGYMFYVLLGLLASILLISVIRIIVYLGVRVGTGAELWIFPNLFEECGILESFVPLYQYNSSSDESNGANPSEKEKKAL